MATGRGQRPASGPVPDGWGPGVAFGARRPGPWGQLRLRTGTLALPVRTRAGLRPLLRPGLLLAGMPAVGSAGVTVVGTSQR